MKDSILLTKSKAFALRIVRLYKYLRERKESVIAKQMLRSGTSIGAIVGGLYAIGYSPQEMLELIYSPNFEYWSTGRINEKLV